MHFKGKVSQMARLTRSPKIVFLCGASEAQGSQRSVTGRILDWLRYLCKQPGYREKSKRALLREYLHSSKDPILTFKAEDAWRVIEKEFQGISALHYEEELGLCSEAIVLIVESYGTATELGAFASNKVLRERLLILVDEKYKDTVSFINLGPIRWADDDSVYSPAIYADLNQILHVAPEVARRLRRPTLGKLKTSSWKKHKKLSPKERLFALVKLVFVLGIANREHLRFYLYEIFGDSCGEKEVAFYLSLAVALGLIAGSTPNGYNSPFFFCPNTTDIGRFMAQKTYQSLSALRATVLNVLGQMSAYRNIETQVRRIHASGTN